MEEQSNLKYKINKYVHKIGRILLAIGYSWGLSGCASYWNMTIKPGELPTRKSNESGMLEGKVVEGTSGINSTE